MRICLLSYRCYRYSGGQGIYVRYLSRSLKELGHDIDVISGPPYPELDDGIKLIKLPSLDLYTRSEIRRFLINPIKLNSLPDLVEWMGECSGFFTEPLTFGMRAYRYLRKDNRYKKYDVIHDNQSLSYSMPKIQDLGIPVVTNIHHPITIDRDLAIDAAKSRWHKMGIRRWYAFADMQIKVAKRLSHFITGSHNSYRQIIDIFKLPEDSLRVIYDGVDSTVFNQAPEIKRSTDSLLTINSGDIPLKGLKYLLEAMAALRLNRKIQLTIVGKPIKNGYTQGLIDSLGIADCVTHLGQISTTELVRQYSTATMVVVPSVYEGFGLPAAEAMCCRTPVVSTTAGALPEIVGDAGILVPPADTAALVEAISAMLDNPDKRTQLAEMGHRRVTAMFNWKNTAIHTADVYREAIERYQIEAQQ
ncbi:MAG: glycosyltransferase family 4 protein, partial [Dehalococcoidia bacterium]|nr:glycosyltransferase family 4 protein [Dehalococcoidia bacterium]